MRRRSLALIFSRILALLFTICFGTACSNVSNFTLELVGNPVPDGRLMLLSGEDLALKDTKGRNRAILFWTTWCTHSRSVISDFEDLARTYFERGDTDFFAVNLDPNENLAAVKERMKSQDLTTVTHVFSGNDTQDEAFLALRGEHVPYSVLIDSEGIVRYVGLGVSGLEEVLRDVGSTSQLLTGN